MSVQVAAVERHVFVPEEERAAARTETFRQLVSRLSHQSVVKHFDAYADIAWDAEEFRIDPLDPRWELGGDDVLGGSAWYRAQPPALRARLGLHLVAHFMKIGLQFEGVLKRGLLAFAGSPASTASWPAGCRRSRRSSPSSSSSSSSAARTPSITCSAGRCAASGRCTLCSGGSCRST